MKAKYSQELADRVEEFLQGNEVTYGFRRESGLICIPLPSLAPEFSHVCLYVIVGEDDLQLQMEYPICFAPAVRTKVKEFIADHSYNLRRGSMQLHPLDGQLFFHTYIDCADGAPSDEVLVRAMAVVCKMLDTFGKELLRLAMPAWGPVAENEALVTEEPTSEELQEGVCDPAIYNMLQWFLEHELERRRKEEREREDEEAFWDDDDQPDDDDTFDGDL